MFGLYLFRLPSAYSRKLLAGLLSVTWSKFGSQGAPHTSRSTRIPLSETAHERTTKNPQSFELCGFRVHLWTALDAKLAEREKYKPMFSCIRLNSLNPLFNIGLHTIIVRHCSVQFAKIRVVG